MPELLLEVGCEELPASFVRRAYEDLRQALRQALEEAGVLDSEPLALGTPRRLIVAFPRVRERQDDATKEVRGPNVQAAYRDGAPTPALLGFCRGQGVSPEEVREEAGYVWATKRVPGRPTRELLSEVLPGAIRGLQFDKSMRWGSSRMRFARPIRWILAAFGGEVVPFEIEGVSAGRASRGHRFYHPGSFTARTFEELLAGLRERFVEPDPERRRARIEEGARQVASGTPELDPDLVDENVFLTEWPSAVQGSFREEYLELPGPVLITAMAKHQRFFPVRDSEGGLTRHFVAIRNAGEDDTVRAGNEWVLNARFNDARFFYQEDLKGTLSGFLEKTAGILFQERLGTVRQRADRLAELAEQVARATGADDEETSWAAQAGLFCKADLSTGLVSELASLQGVIGGEYARREGLPDPVCWAIASHYDLSRNASPRCAGGRTAVRVLVADQLDKLAGYLGLGLEPSGSSDPYGLRRSATLLIEAAWGWPGPFPSYASLLEKALEGYARQGARLDSEGARRSLVETFVGRYEALLADARHDLLDAALLRQVPEAALDAQGVRFRLECLSRLADDVPFVQTATRPLNIVAAAEKKGVAFAREHPFRSFSPPELGSEEGEELLAAALAAEDRLAGSATDVDATCRALAALAAPINRFFDKTMVMVEDERQRAARLSLLRGVCDLLLRAGDFSKIVVEG